MTWDYAEYINQIIDDDDKLFKARDIIGELVDKMKDAPEVKDALCKIHCVAYGCHFNKSLALNAVSEMQNVDGSIGEHWPYEAIKQIAESKGIDETWDLYYAMNMLHSDTSKIFGNDTNKYYEVARALYFDDPDAPEGKLFRQWIAMKN